MKKISQLPEIEKYTGDEMSPIVQAGTTKKAFTLFVDNENKTHVPENITIVGKYKDADFPLLSTTDKKISLAGKGFSIESTDTILVTDAAKTDNKSYVMINNKWTEKNPVTQINDVTAPVGGGKVTVAAKDVKAHIENSNASGYFVSEKGSWVDIATATKTLLDAKANKTHTHAISDVTNLQTTLDGKANKTHTHAISDVTNLQTTIDTINSNTSAVDKKVTDLATKEASDIKTLTDGKANKTHTHAIADVTGLDAKFTALNTKTDNTNADVAKINSRLQTAFFYSKDSAFTGTDAAGTLPITMKRSLKTSAADNKISFEEAGDYFIQLTANIKSDGTVVTMSGVPDMSLEGKGYCSISGVFDIADSTKISLGYTGANSIVETNITIYRI